MRQFLVIFLFGLFCGIAGFGAGVWSGPQVKSFQPVRFLASSASAVPWAKSLAQLDDNSPFEMYNYPVIKWRAKPLSDAPGAIAQLWTTYEWSDKQHQSGTMNYRLTVFKAPEGQREVQLLDENGFKITQFYASDFHKIPGSSDIMEARDSHPCTEEQYKRVGDYSIK